MSERTVKYSRHDVFSPLFLPPRSVFINASGRQGRQGEHRSLGCDNIDRAFAPKMVKLKKVSQRTDKYSRHGVFIPFFLPPSSVFINSSRQQQQRGKHWSMWAMMEETFAQKCAMGNKDKFAPLTAPFVCLLFPIIQICMLCILIGEITNGQVCPHSSKRHELKEKHKVLDAHVSKFVSIPIG